ARPAAHRHAGTRRHGRKGQTQGVIHMAKPSSLGSTVSFAVLASLLAGCAASQDGVKAASNFGCSGVDICLATRALAALNSNNVPAGMDFAGRAVAKTPN